MFVFQTNPVGVELFSYANTFFLFHMSENALYFSVVSRRSPDRADLFAWREGVPCNLVPRAFPFREKPWGRGCVPCNPFSYERL